MRYHKAREQRFQPGDCGWLCQMLQRTEYNEDYEIPVVFSNEEDSDSGGKNFSGASKPRSNAVD